MMVEARNLMHGDSIFTEGLGSRRTNHIVDHVVDLGPTVIVWYATSSNQVAAEFNAGRLVHVETRSD